MTGNELLNPHIDERVTLVDNQKNAVHSLGQSRPPRFVALRFRERMADGNLGVAALTRDQIFQVGDDPLWPEFTGEV